MVLLVFLGTLFGSMIFGIPIAYSLLLSGIALMWNLDFFDTQIIAQNLINGATSYTLLAIPFFLLAGEVMNAGGLSKRLVSVASTLVGHRRGGLGYVTILSACLLASLSGSAVADAAALSTLLVPMMAAAGHDRGRSVGLVAAGGIIGPVIPPSIALILFGVAGGLSITKLFLAGVVPGVLLGLALGFAWWVVSKNEDIALQPKQSLFAVFKAMADGIWALMLPVIIIFGLRFGIFTPTEAGVVAAVYALFVAVVVYRELKLSELLDVFVKTAVGTGVVMFLVAAALVAAWLITIADIPGRVITLIEPLMGHQTLLLLAVMALVFVIGCVMDMSPIILIMTPVLLPAVIKAGIDPIYFGVLFVVCASIGLITPPVGVVLNVVAGATDTKMIAVVKGIWPFLLAQVIVLVLLVLFPALVTLPLKWMMG